MNLNSRLFDKIRTRPKRAEDTQSTAITTCEHPGCVERGQFRAPKGRDQERQYWFFCLEHVRSYNQSYNYFQGMSDHAVASYQKNDTTGHRPTWAMGVNPNSRDAQQIRKNHNGSQEANAKAHEIDDSFGLFKSQMRQKRNAPEDENRQHLSGTALKALDQLGLDAGVDSATIKARYKLLVKRFHPDANGGDRSLEERLQEILRAYNILKALGMV